MKTIISYTKLTFIVIYYMLLNIMFITAYILVTVWTYLHFNLTILGGFILTNFKMIIQYDGTRYSGWQKQGNTDNTIQGKLEAVLKKMTGEDIEIHGSGRTDAGVHALGQVANFKSDTQKSTKEIQSYINEYLPLDIRVISVDKANPRFHARLNACKKHYRYTIDNRETAGVFLRKYMTRSTEKYNIDNMRKAASFLIGEHDFKSFCDNKRMKKSTVRTIEKIEISDNDGILTMDFYGNGFLYHMVRILTGTLLNVGTGKLKPDDIINIIDAKSREAAGFTASPQGLMLVEVTY